RLEVALELLRQRQHAPRMPHDQPAALGQLDAASPPVEQATARIPLERADLLADRRLADAKRLRGRRERPAVRDLGERSELAQIHKRSLSRRHVLSATRA